MLKETIISIIIVVAVSLGNVITQNYTKESVSKINEKLEGMTAKIESAISNDNDNNERIMSEVKEIKEEWEKRHDKLACYIEHDELEKVDDKIVSLESNIKTKDYEQAMTSLKEGVFFLQHIQEKYALNFTNIF